MQWLEPSPLLERTPGAQTLLDPGMAIGIEMNAIRLQPLQPVRLSLHGPVKAEIRNIHLQTGFLDLGFMQSNVAVAVPKTVGEWHGVFIDRRQPEDKNGAMGLNGPQQLFKAEAKGLRIKRLSAVRAPDPSRVIEPHR